MYKITNINNQNINCGNAFSCQQSSFDDCMKDENCNILKVADYKDLSNVFNPQNKQKYCQCTLKNNNDKFDLIENIYQSNNSGYYSRNQVNYYVKDKLVKNKDFILLENMHIYRDPFNVLYHKSKLLVYVKEIIINLKKINYSYYNLNDVDKKKIIKLCIDEYNNYYSRLTEKDTNKPDLLSFDGTNKIFLYNSKQINFFKINNINNVLNSYNYNNNDQMSIRKNINFDLLRSYLKTNTSSRMLSDFKFILYFPYKNKDFKNNSPIYINDVNKLTNLLKKNNELILYLKSERLIEEFKQKPVQQKPVQQKPVQQKPVKKENFTTNNISVLEKINKVSDILFNDVLNVDNLICNDIDVLNKTTFNGELNFKYLNSGNIDVINGNSISFKNDSGNFEYGFNSNSELYKKINNKFVSVNISNNNIDNINSKNIETNNFNTEYLPNNFKSKKELRFSIKDKNSIIVFSENNIFSKKYINNILTNNPIKINNIKQPDYGFYLQKNVPYYLSYYNTNLNFTNSKRPSNYIQNGFNEKYQIIVPAGNNYIIGMPLDYNNYKVYKYYENNSNFMKIKLT